MPADDVQGATVDQATLCSHWHGPTDVVAFKFPCCGAWYPCRACHDEATDHATETWGPDDRDEPAVLCGVCRTTMTIAAYVGSEHACPACDAAFNPRCQAHWPRYFTLDGDAAP